MREKVAKLGWIGQEYDKGFCKNLNIPHVVAT
jgi:hypothetical protein